MISNFKYEIDKDYGKIIDYQRDQQRILNDEVSLRKTRLLEKQNKFFVDFFIDKGWTFVTNTTKNTDPDFKHEYTIFYVFDEDGFGFVFNNNGYCISPLGIYETNYMLFYTVRISDKLFVSTDKYGSENQYSLFRSRKETLEDVYNRFTKKFNQKEKERVLRELQEDYPKEFRYRKLLKLKKL